MNPIRFVAFAGLKTCEYFLKNITWTMRTGAAPGLKRRYGAGLLPRTLQPTIEEAFVYSLDLQGSTVYDVGGYIGLYALAFARAVGAEGHVITFEPSPYNYAELVANVQLNGFSNVRMFQYGINDTPGEAWFVRDPVSPARSHIVNATTQARKLKVQLESLDHIQQREQLPVPDFIKVDVEGHEHAVFKGAERLIKQHSPELLIELHGEVSPPLISAIRAYGYTIRHLEGNLMIDETFIPALVNGHLFCSLPGKRNWDKVRGML